MTSNEEIIQSTKRLLRDLKYFTIHVIIYLPSNILLVLFAVKDLEENWWAFVPILFWAVALIYHGVLINTSRVKKLKSLMSV